MERICFSHWRGETERDVTCYGLGESDGGQLGHAQSSRERCVAGSWKSGFKCHTRWTLEDIRVESCGDAR